MKFKKGDPVKINPKTINRKLDNTRYFYVAESILGNDSQYTIDRIEDEFWDDLGCRVHVVGYSGYPTRFWVFEKDLLHCVKYYEVVEEEYLI